MSAPSDLILEKTQLVLPPGSSLSSAACDVNPSCCGETTPERITVTGCGDQVLSLPKKLYARFEWLPVDVKWEDIYGTIDPLDYDAYFGVDKYCGWISTQTYTLNYFVKSTPANPGFPFTWAYGYDSWNNCLGDPLYCPWTMPSYPCCRISLYLAFGCGQYSYYTGNKIYPNPGMPEFYDWELKTDYYFYPMLQGAVYWHTSWDPGTQTCRYTTSPLFSPGWGWQHAFHGYSFSPVYIEAPTRVWKRVIIWE